MAASPSLSSRNWRYNVFVSFRGPDVRKTFLAHLRKQFSYNLITMYDDQKMERSATIAPSLTEAIRQSKISILIFSKKYASSSWCLNELLEILECKKALGQIVMTIFYQVDPSDVRDQTGDFGKAFDETCDRKTEDDRKKWRQALTVAGNIAGEHFLKWDNEAEMIESIARDVSNKLVNATPSKYFDGIVGLNDHLIEMESLLHLDSKEVKMVAISGPAGIGKSTIARALLDRFSSRFQLTGFVDNLRKSYPIGLDEFGLKLRLQEDLFSTILNQSGIRITHPGVIKERLRDHRVLIVLDDVNNILQLEALADKTTWFGPGSRIVVTTENKDLLQQHGINDRYHVRFPSNDQAVEILCRYAFRQRYPHDGFEELAKRVTEICGNLPLGLRVVGSSLCGKKKDEWEGEIRRLDSDLYQENIEKVLRLGYESLHEHDKSLFVHIALFFNYKDCDIVEALFADNNTHLDIKHGLKILANKCLIDISTHGEIVMHKLLQQMGQKAARREDPWKRKILIDAQEIREVLEDDERHQSPSFGVEYRQVSGISFDISGIREMFINKRAFKRMSKLQFLKVIKSKDDGNTVVHIPKNMNFPRDLRLLHWEAYPARSFPRSFNLEYLVELNMKDNQLEKLWEGTRLLPNLKRMDLSGSLNLKELPDLSKATSLERLVLHDCSSLVEIPPSIGDLHKLEELEMSYCIQLQVVPTSLNLASLKIVDMIGCSQLRKFPHISKSITMISITDTILDELPDSFRFWSGLENLHIYGPFNVHDPCPDIEKLPDWIKHLDGLHELLITDMPYLGSLPEFPSSLRKLTVANCESLETLMSFPFDSQIEELYFPNCFELGLEARRVITEEPFLACLPGETMPAEFDHQAIGNSLTIRSDFRKFRICAVVSPKPQMTQECRLFCRIHINGCLIEKDIDYQVHPIQTEHLFISDAFLGEENGWLEQDNEISFQFSTAAYELTTGAFELRTSLIEVTECGVQIFTFETDGRVSRCDSCDCIFDQVSEDDDKFDEPRVKRLKT